MTPAEFAVNFFVALFALIDPVGMVPLFAAATAGVHPSARRSIALYVSLFAAAFLTFFFFTGTALLKFFGISLPAFRIAGGLMLLLMGLNMARDDFTAMFATAVVEGAETTDLRAYARKKFEKLIVPFGMPLLIGPGAISAVVIYASESKPLGWAGALAGVAVILGVSACVLVAFALSGLISKALGQIGMTIVVRVLGLVLTAMAVQFIIVGVSGATLGIVRASAAHPYPAPPSLPPRR